MKKCSSKNVLIICGTVLALVLVVGLIVGFTDLGRFKDTFHITDEGQILRNISMKNIDSMSTVVTTDGTDYYKAFNKSIGMKDASIYVLDFEINNTAYKGAGTEATSSKAATGIYTLVFTTANIKFTVYDHAAINNGVIEYSKGNALVVMHFSGAYATVRPGSVNITSVALKVVNGYSVTQTLNNCTTSNSSIVSGEGDTFTTTITAKTGYTLTGATVTVTMGGTDVTSSVWNANIAKVNIVNVTGDVVITVTAVEVE